MHECHFLQHYVVQPLQHGLFKYACHGWSDPRRFPNTSLQLELGSCGWLRLCMRLRQRGSVSVELQRRGEQSGGLSGYVRGDEWLQKCRLLLP